ncbi:thiamine pyrophosphate-binding protein [Streptomyces iconiensis]|uniref:Thiamine pyrophosphate-binding protein n=1 Tax=Streptomyces iconiensis TaxID=1384038 RepID=A0ABT7A2B0_9ACTN|nr:thiamine pyrophosphate-binding protein [Streptomyces iconiensis]MDJ1135436.1 thiamine pyrophosphate-binding protein [Streptomyces iconiensis]
MPAPNRTVAETLLHSLRAHDVDRIFCVAGESYLPLLDALYDSEVDVLGCRHEGSAGFAALADAKLTGRAGVCLVSRAPGAANAAIAVHAAAEDATALVVLVGDVPTRELGRESFQSGRPLGDLTKAVLTLYTPEATGETVRRAFRVAESGTPGPVVLHVPEDVFDRTGADQPAGRVTLGHTVPGERDFESVHGLLTAARRPLLLAGSMLDTASGRTLLRQTSQRHSLPVVTSNKNQHLLENRHRCYAGHLHNSTQPQQLAEFDRADLVLAVGTRLGQISTRRLRFPRGPEPDQALVHVHPDPARIGRYHRVTAGFAMDPVDFLGRLDAAGPPHRLPNGRDRWCEGLHALEEDNARWVPPDSGEVTVGEIASALDELTEGAVTVIVDSGTFTSWTYRFLRFAQSGRLVGIDSSAMGFAPGAALAVGARTRTVPTVALVGDGGFVMNGGELATLCERRLPVVFVVSDNASLGTIRLHQQQRYPDRGIATDLENPDFPRLAQAFGALGLAATTADEVRTGLAKALDHPGPSLLSVRTSRKHLTPYHHL